MAEAWYVPVTSEYSADLKSHLFRAGVPDDVYDIPNAWDQEEIEFGLWKLSFRDGVLTSDMRRRMKEMGCKPVADGRPMRAVSMPERAEALKKTTVAEVPK